MTFYIFELFNKIYNFFEIKIFKNKSIQTDIRLFTDNKLTQTDYIPPLILLEKSTQTNINLLDKCEDSDWDNLIWINDDINNIV